jgi:hypothetical protein
MNITELDDIARQLIGSNPATLVTINRDGSPQVSVVWVTVQSTADGGDELVTAHLMEHQKIRNIRRTPRIPDSRHDRKDRRRGPVGNLNTFGPPGSKSADVPPAQPLTPVGWRNGVPAGRRRTRPRIPRPGAASAAADVGVRSYHPTHRTPAGCRAPQRRIRP